MVDKFLQVGLRRGGVRERRGISAVNLFSSLGHTRYRFSLYVV